MCSVLRVLSLFDFLCEKVSLALHLLQAAAQFHEGLSGSSGLALSLAEGVVPSGLERGQLPGGYVPLPTELAAQTVAAAKTVRDLQPLQTATPAPATPAPATPAPATPAPAPLVSQAPETPPAPTAAPTASRSEARPRTASNAAAPATETVLTAPTDTAPPTEEDAAAVSRPEQAPLEQQRAIVATPSQGTGPVGRVAVPVLGVMALTSALLALELTKRPRRSLEPDTPRPDGP